MSTSLKNLVFLVHISTIVNLNQDLILSSPLKLLSQCRYLPMMVDELSIFVLTCQYLETLYAFLLDTISNNRGRFQVT